MNIFKGMEPIDIIQRAGKDYLKKIEFVKDLEEYSEDIEKITTYIQENIYELPIQYRSKDGDIYNTLNMIYNMFEGLAPDWRPTDLELKTFKKKYYLSFW